MDVRNIETINLELVLADMETVKKRLDKAEKYVKTGEKAYIDEAQLLKKLYDHLEKGQCVRTLPLSDDEKEIIALSGSEQEVNAQRQQREVTAKYPLLQFMGMVEKVTIFGSVENRNLSNCYCMSLLLMRIFSRIMM